jgi:hypothetical protein
MTIIKRVKPAKVAILHNCTEEYKINQLVDNINKLSIIITGNGDPESSLCNKLSVVKQRQDGVLKKLDEIHVSLEDYHSETKEAKNIAVVVQSAFEKYQAETTGVKKGREEASTKQQVSFNNLISIVGTIIMVIGLIITALVGKNEREKIEQRINNFGTPVILNSRGHIDELPAGDSLKFFRDGEFKTGYKDSIK